MPDADPNDISWKDVRVLVADDEPEMREIFVTWFRNLGCDVSEAADGLEALELAQRSTFEAVITDVRMPRMDGVEFAKKLAETINYTPVVIFVSGFHDLPASEAYDLGIEAILAKPCSRKDVVQALRACLLRRHLQFPALDKALPANPATFDRIFNGSVDDAQVAIGHGGFSACDDLRLEPSSHLVFQLEFSAGPVLLLKGTGQVRWREEALLSPRIGIEFTSLAESSREQLLAYFQSERPRSFIPRDCRTRRATSQP